jgi:hypothetical protein
MFLRRVPDCSVGVSSCVCLFEIRRLLKQERLRRAGTGGRFDPYVYMVREICSAEFVLEWECQIQNILCVFG